MKKPTALRLQLFLAGVSQTEIAQKAGVSVAFINQVVWGKEKASVKAKKAFVETTGLKEENLFGGEKKKAS
jgi:cyanate lyase